MYADLGASIANPASTYFNSRATVFAAPRTTTPTATTPLPAPVLPTTVYAPTTIAPRAPVSAAPPSVYAPTATFTPAAPLPTFTTISSSGPRPTVMFDESGVGVGVPTDATKSPALWIAVGIGALLLLNRKKGR